MYTLGVGRILTQSIIIVCFFNLMAWKAGWAHRTGENEKKNNDKIKKSVQTSSACGPFEAEYWARDNLCESEVEKLVISLAEDSSREED